MKQSRKSDKQLPKIEWTQALLGKAEENGVHRKEGRPSDKGQSGRMNTNIGRIQK